MEGLSASSGLKEGTSNRFGSANFFHLVLCASVEVEDQRSPDVRALVAAGQGRL